MVNYFRILGDKFSKPQLKEIQNATIQKPLYLFSMFASPLCCKICFISISMLNYYFYLIILVCRR